MKFVISIWNYAILEFFLLLSSSCGHLTFDIYLLVSLIFFIYTDSIELIFFEFIYLEFFFLYFFFFSLEPIDFKMAI
jgi:hypothetical protein